MTKILKPGRILLAAMLLTTGCSSDDEEFVDPRAAFVGEYETEDYDLSYSLIYNNSPQIDTTIVANGGTEIEIYLVEDDKREIRFEGLDEFIESGCAELNYAIGGNPVNFMATIDEEVIAEVEGNEFELEDTDFTLTTTVNNIPSSTILSLSGQGSLNENILVLEFEYSGTGAGGSLTFSGEVEMEKEG